MKIKKLGRTGLKVSEICLGTMTFGNQCDEAASFAIMDAAYEAGVFFFDTADVYPLGATPEQRGSTEVIVSEHRPVPLWQHVMVRDQMVDLFVDDAQQELNPELVRLARRSGFEEPRRGRRPTRSCSPPPPRPAVTRQLSMLPATRRGAAVRPRQ